MCVPAGSLREMGVGRVGYLTVRGVLGASIRPIVLCFLINLLVVHLPLIY